MDQSIWTVTDHVCVQCLGRVLQQGETYRCSQCGANGQGEPAVICACGIAAPKLHGRTVFRCGPNPRRVPGEPEIAVLFDG
jgi:hypothetical protein